MDQKKQIILLLALVGLAAVWAVTLGPLSLFEKEGDARSSREESILVNDMQWIGIVALIRSANEPFQYDPADRQDPMIVTARMSGSSKIEGPSEPVELPTLLLTGIIWDQRKPVAMINGEAFRENDVVEGARILKIELYKVTLVYRSRKFDIELL